MSSYIRVSQHIVQFHVYSDQILGFKVKMTHRLQLAKLCDLEPTRKPMHLVMQIREKC